MNKPLTSISPYIIVIFIIWSLVIVGLATWKINQNTKITHELAENQARANFNKDKAFRLWLTGHGRIYIPVGEQYQPDPYLAHILDRDVTTPSGIKLSMVNPARIVRELDKEYRSLYGIAGKVTSLTPLRSANKPDAWENTALLQIEEGVLEIFEYTSINDQPYLRLMQPLPIKEGCLLCHKNLLKKDNGIGGGVSIALPMAHFLNRQNRQNREDIQLFIIIWSIGILGLVIAFFHLQRQTRGKENAIGALTLSQSQYKAIMDSALDCIISIDKDGLVTAVNPATEKTFGYEHSLMIGRDLAELIIPQELREMHHAGMKRLLATGESTILNTRIETQAQHADGSQFPVELTITQIHDRDDVFFTAYLRDLTEAHELKEKLTFQASHDALTGLMNRHAFEDYLESLVTEIDEQSQHCLLYLDIDQLKAINDHSGHVAGDELLRQIGQLMNKNKRAGDTLACLGGDEFALLLKDCSLDEARNIAGELIESVRKYRFQWEDKVYSIGVSIGLAPTQGQSVNFSELMSAADAACNEAKKQGRNRFFVFEQDDEELSRRRGQIAWVSRIQSAMEEDRMLLYKQAIQPIGNHDEEGKLHFEVLIRMMDTDGDIIGPDQFIPAAERFNLMLLVDKWVINKTFLWLSTFDGGLDKIGLCSINLSGYSITDDSFSAYIESKLQEYKLPANIICFEITETVAITNLVKASQFMDELHGVGCKFALDDFGTGVSSFGYLKNLAVDYLKIDGEFVKDITTNRINLAMVKSINEVGHVMGKKTIAEYVEDQQTVAMLEEMGVDYVQGYVFSHPGPLE